MGKIGTERRHRRITQEHHECQDEAGERAADSSKDSLLVVIVRPVCPVNKAKEQLSSAGSRLHPNGFPVLIRGTHPHRQGEGVPHTREHLGTGSELNMKLGTTVERTPSGAGWLKQTVAKGSVSISGSIFLREMTLRAEFE
jgi:hypothetical protein